MRGTEGHLGLQFFPQELSNELGPLVTVNDLGNPVCGKTSLAVMVFEQGTRMASLVRLQTFAT